jgi:hypothetical protein
MTSALAYAGPFFDLVVFETLNCEVTVTGHPAAVLPVYFQGHFNRTSSDRLSNFIRSSTAYSRNIKAALEIFEESQPPGTYQPGNKYFPVP